MSEYSGSGTVHAHRRILEKIELLRSLIQLNDAQLHVLEMNGINPETSATKTMNDMRKQYLAEVLEEEKRLFDLLSEQTSAEVSAVG